MTATLTRAGLDARVAEQARNTAAAASAARRRIDRGLADAEAHALKALTGTLRDAPEGRPTLAQARRSPSLKAATARLGELAADLADMVKDYRAAAYEDSFGYWKAHVDPEHHRSDDPAPRSADMARVAAAVVHGYTVEGWLAGPILAAGRGLRAKVAQAGSRALPASEGPGLLAAWRAGARKAILANVEAALIDSATYADRAAGRDLFRPELLHDDPTMP